MYINIYIYIYIECRYFNSFVIFYLMTCGVCATKTFSWPWLSPLRGQG